MKLGIERKRKKKMIENKILIKSGNETKIAQFISEIMEIFIVEHGAEDLYEIAKEKGFDEVEFDELFNEILYYAGYKDYDDVWGDEF